MHDRNEELEAEVSRLRKEVRDLARSRGEERAARRDAERAIAEYERASQATIASLSESILWERGAFRRAISTAVVRFDILRGRMEACDAGERDGHGLSLLEIDGWREEMLRALADEGKDGG